MDDAVFWSKCGLAYIGVPVIHSVNDYLRLSVCIHYSIKLAVVESRTYAVAIVAAKIPCPACVVLAVYEDMAAYGTKWGGIIVKWAVEFSPS